MQNLGRHTIEHLEFCLLSPAEAQLEEVNLEWPERGDEHVEAHVELLAADEQRVVDVSGDHVGLLHQVGVEHGPALSRPLLQLGELVDQEDSAPLRLPARLHYPRGVGIFPGDTLRSNCEKNLNIYIKL